VRANKISVDRTKKESQRDLKMARGGKTHMFGKQAAGKDKPGNTGKDQSAAPGARFARGRPRKISYSSSVPATPGITGPRDVVDFHSFLGLYRRYKPTSPSVFVDGVRCGRLVQKF
jgi:hypothetical protein